MPDGGDSAVTNVAKISPEHRSLEAPTELKDLPSWCVWRYESAGEGTKPLKVPYWPGGGRRHGKQGGPEDRGKLTTFAAAKDAAAKRGMDGVGFAPMPEWGITALDFDNCVDADGNLPSEVLQIVGRTYSEWSPSGKGVRAFVRGSLGNRKSPSTATQYGVETFSSTGFVTVTGQVLPVVEMLELEDYIAPVDERIIDLCTRRFGPQDHALDDDFMAGREPRLGLSVERTEELLSALDPDLGRDDWIRVGMAVHHESEGDDTGFVIWDEWSQQGAKYPGEEALRSQWDSFTRRAGPGQRQVTMASVIKMAQEASALSLDDLRALASTVTTEADSGPRTPDGFDGKFRAYSAAEIATRPPVDWLVKGIIPKGTDPIVLFGPSGSGKSFVATDVAASVARGADWYGRKVRQGRVLIVMAEGSGGAPQRVRAYSKKHGIDPAQIDIAFVTAAPNFLDKGDIGEIIKTIAAVGNVVMTVIDTFAQVTPGANENAGEDMGPALRNAQVIAEVTGATVVLIHHTGKDASKGSRGWSGIKGAAAAQIEIIRHDDGQREIHVEKMKDGKDGERLGFKLEEVNLGFDADGDPLESLVVVPAELKAGDTEDSAPARSVVRYGKHERHVLEVMESVYASDNEAPYDVFLSRCVEMMPAPVEGKRDVRRFEINRAIQSLAKRKDAPIVIDRGKVIFCS